MDLGPGKLSFAWFSNTDNDFSYEKQLNNNGKVQKKDGLWEGDDSWDGKTVVVTEKYDIEYGLTPWDGAWLNLRGTLLVPEVDDNNYMKLVDQPKFSNGNILAVSLDNYYSLGSCKTVVQFISKW